MSMRVRIHIDSLRALLLLSALLVATGLWSSDAAAQEQVSGLSTARPLTISPASFAYEDPGTTDPVIQWRSPEGIGGDSLTVGTASLALEGRVANADANHRLQIGFEQVPLGDGGRFETELPLRFGMNESRVRLRDQDGNTIIEKRLFIRYADVEAPSIRVYEPAPRSPGEVTLTTDASVEFHGRVLDNVGVDRLTINGDEIPLGDEARFTHEVGLFDGEINTVYLEATDTYGNLARDSVKVLRQTDISLTPSLLSDLSIDPGSLSRPFDPLETHYSVKIASDATQIRVQASAFEGNPTIRLFGMGLPGQGVLLRPGEPSYALRLPTGSSSLTVRVSGPGAAPVEYNLTIARSR